MADHKVIKGATSSGFEYSVVADMLKNAEFLELFAKVQGGDTLKSFDLIEMALGADQKKKLYDHIRNEDGIVLIDTLTEEITEIFEELGKDNDVKN